MQCVFEVRPKRIIRYQYNNDNTISNKNATIHQLMHLPESKFGVDPGLYVTNDIQEDLGPLFGGYFKKITTLEEFSDYVTGFENGTIYVADEDIFGNLTLRITENIELPEPIPCKEIPQKTIDYLKHEVSGTNGKLEKTSMIYLPEHESNETGFTATCIKLFGTPICYYLVYRHVLLVGNIVWYPHYMKIYEFYWQRIVEMLKLRKEFPM